MTVATYPAYRYAREIELCTEVSRFIRVAKTSETSVKTFH